MRSWNLKGAVSAFAAASLVLSPAVATAATSSSYHGPDPLAVLSVMSSGASATVLCGTAAAAAAQATAPGCVLPQIDAQPPVATNVLDQPIPAPLPGAAGAGFGVSPLLIGLFALAAGVGLYLLLNNNGNNNNNPVSPA